MTSIRFSGGTSADTTFDPAHSSSQRSVDLTDGTPPPSRRSVKMTLTGSSSPGERYFFVFIPQPPAVSSFSDVFSRRATACSPVEYAINASAVHVLCSGRIGVIRLRHFKFFAPQHILLLSNSDRHPMGSREPRGKTMNIARSLNNWRKYRQTVTELGRMSDRELRDLGIGREDIRRVARHAVAG